MNKKDDKKQIQIRAKDEDLKGAYTNLMQVVHTQEEFVLDFFNVTGSAGVLQSRIILSPGHFKRMMLALQDNLKKHEDAFGEVKTADTPNNEVGFGE